MNNKDFSNNSNQNLISDRNQYPNEEEIKNNNINQIANNNETSSENNFIPLEVSLPPAETLVISHIPKSNEEEKIALGIKQDINEPAPVISSPPSIDNESRTQKVVNLTRKKKKEEIVCCMKCCLAVCRCFGCFCDCINDCCQCECCFGECHECECCNCDTHECCGCDCYECYHVRFCGCKCFSNCCTIF